MTFLFFVLSNLTTTWVSLSRALLSATVQLCVKLRSLTFRLCGRIIVTSSTDCKKARTFPPWRGASAFDSVLFYDRVFYQGIGFPSKSPYKYGYFFVSASVSSFSAVSDGSCCGVQSFVAPAYPCDVFIQPG